MSAAELRLFKEVSRLSLENAERWTKDAKLLVDASSLEHAFVLMRFASEEIAKFLVCWHVSEGIWPAKDNRLVKEVFHDHKIKNHILFGFMLNLFQGQPVEEFRIEDYNRHVKYIEKSPLFKNIAFYAEKLRQTYIYVDVNWKEGKVLTLKPMNQKIAIESLQGLEDAIGYMRRVLEGGFSEQDKKRLRDFYKHIPKEAWKTGEIPIEWFEKSPS